LIDQLFGSKTRVKLLQLFYSNPNRSFYVREITRKIDEQINSVRRELSNLLSIGIITSDTNNNKLYYEVNQKFNYYQPLSAIFGNKPYPATATATDAPAPEAGADSDDDMIKKLRAVGKVDLVLLTGQFTRDELSGIDLLIVGDVNAVQVKKFVEEFEKQEGKEIRYVVMNTKEYLYRIEINDRFVTQLLAAKKQVVINDQDLKIE
jgi:hypothetical protein